MKKSIFVVIPNYNGADRLAASIDSVLRQNYTDFDLIIVDNGSVDASRTIIESYQAKDPRVRVILRDKNYGYTGGVNPGMGLAIQEGIEFVAPFNNDAIADKDWLKQLVHFLRQHPSYGIAACAMLHGNGKTIDSTGEQYTTWGLSFPRGRDEPAGTIQSFSRDIFGGSGGASMYRVKMLAEVGVFDQDFFAYYEDADLSFRAQLAGWKVGFVAEAVVYHDVGQTSSSMRSGFLTYQYMKNVPMIVIKDLPARYMWYVLPRFWLAYTLFFWNAVFKGKGRPALKGWLMSIGLFPKKLVERRHIQKSRTVSQEYIWSILTHELPPNAHKLRNLLAPFNRSFRNTKSN
jgi:GT2 family glycosyltransferase